MCAIDFPDTDTRNRVADKAYDLGLVILGCGHRSLRFRPPLDITAAEIDEALEILTRAMAQSQAKSA
jgi:L-lysine 6-transaminase